MILSKILKLEIKTFKVSVFKEKAKLSIKINKKPSYLNEKLIKTKFISNLHYKHLKSL